jgi:hypothetical protein
MIESYRGKNRHRLILKAGKIIAGKISKLDGVIGILGTGSIGRRFGDIHSDLDLLVYAEDKVVPKVEKLVSIGMIRYKELEYDIVVIPYREAKKAKSPSEYWSQMIRWDRGLSQILFDTNDRIKMLLKDKLIYPDWEQKQLLKKYRGEVQEFLIYYPEIWSDRGRLYNIIDSLFRANQSIILWIYAKNKAFEPYVPKWLFYHLETQGVPEYIYLDRLTKIYRSNPNTIAKAFEIRNDLINLCEQIGITFNYYDSLQAWSAEKENWLKLPDESKRILMW